MMKRLAAILILTLLLNPVSFAQKKFTPDDEIVYKTIDRTQLKLHVFYPDNHRLSDTRPAIVFFFGGGWNGGSPNQFYPHCEYLASRGMVAMAAEYRTKKSHDTPPSTCVMDGKSALRWVRQYAADMGIHPKKIAAGGGSAGGHVAAAVATTDGFEEAGEKKRISYRPNALVLFNPVYDNGPDGYGHDRVQAYWEEFSPMHNIHKKMPPTIVFLGTKDKLIPVETAKEFQARMKKVRVRSELFLYEDQPHGFFNYKNYPNYAKTVIEMDKFLKSLGYLQGEPTLKMQSIELFDGKTLDGWQNFGGGKFYVEDGVIVGETAPGLPNSFLATDKMYRNFELELDVKVDPLLNSGIQIRSNVYEKETTTIRWGGTFNEDGSKNVRERVWEKGRFWGYQVELDPTERGWSGALYEEGARGFLHTPGESEKALKAFKPNEWNHVRILVIGDHFQTWINGVPVANMHDNQTPTGYIALQLHGIGKNQQKAGKKILFKNLKMTEF
jgi:acetyl esterase/lipase